MQVQNLAPEFTMPAPGLFNINMAMVSGITTTLAIARVSGYISLWQATHIPQVCLQLCMVPPAHQWDEAQVL